MAFKIVLTCNCIAGHWLAGLHFCSTCRLAEPRGISDCFFCRSRPMQFFTSNSLAAHLGGGRGGQGGVPVTEGPKVSAFQGFGEGKPKVLDTVTGETLTAPPGAIHSPLGNCLRTNISNLANSTHKLCYRPMKLYPRGHLSRIVFIAGLELILAG